jgi:adenylosuccinate lyase
MVSVVEGLGVDRQRLSANLRTGAPGQGGVPGGVLAEPAYILLAESGASNAHEIIRRITLRAEKEGLTFAAALSADKAVLDRIAAKMTELGIIQNRADALSFFEQPERYRGLSAEKAGKLSAKYRKLMTDGGGGA